jgi:protein-S-isoprenylcysteine O-methyltransferase Ste14
VPLENSAGLATYGPYRYSRNPMYVSLLVMYTGEALVLGQLWPFLLLPFVIAYLQWILIPHEEDRLTKIFGEVYLRYCMGVNRWI